MAGKQTVRVVPFQVRRAGREVADVGDAVTKTGGGMRDWSDSVEALDGWRVAAGCRTQVSTWAAYLSRLGSKVAGYGDRLVKVANAYEACDAEAAEALGVALPKDGPSDVRPRPGRVPM